MTLAMSDEDVVRMFADIVGCGYVVIDCPRSNRKRIWRWQLCRKSDIERVLNLFLPYLGDRRRAKALEVLPWCKYKPTYEGRT